MGLSPRACDAQMMIVELLLPDRAAEPDKGRFLTVADECVSVPQPLSVDHRL